MGDGDSSGAISGDPGDPGSDAGSAVAGDAGLSDGVTSSDGFNSDFSDSSISDGLNSGFNTSDFSDSSVTDGLNTGFNMSSIADPSLSDISSDVVDGPSGISSAGLSAISAVLGFLGIPAPVTAAINTAVTNNPAGLVTGLMGPLGVVSSVVSALTGTPSISESFSGLPAMSESDIAEANSNNSDPSNAGFGRKNMAEDLMGTGLDSGLTGLAQLYEGYKSQRGIDNMLGSLQDLYSPNSAYAQQMRQQLERRDAAAGRRSQYGPREVELQSNLARMASGQIPAMSQLMQQSNNNRNMVTNGTLALLQKSGMLKNLSQLFGGGNSWSNGANIGGGTGPYYDSSGMGYNNPSAYTGGSDFSNYGGGGDYGGLLDMFGNT